ncbi:MAG TPA: ATP-binding cassette domain-containing protein [Thermoguttaceae bacterium]|nr:ATP-binding cassette domain-containing protein [Thermoguttaceae bacterium]
MPLPPADSLDAPILRIDGLGVCFGHHRVLQNIHLTIQRGETVAVIGESGCGKTVLLKTLIALLRPTEGAVYFEGQDLLRLNEKQLTAQRIRYGFLFQMAALFDSMTVAQNVAFPLRQHTNRPEREIQRIVVERLTEVGLPRNVLARKPAELSGGMRKRVGLARAMVLEPELLLYDEPTTGLDPIMSDVINELMLNTRRRHPVTSILVTHDMRTAQKVADRIVMLYPTSRLGPDEPQVIFDGPARRIESCADRRVQQFVRGEAGERITEMQLTNGGR